jgi:hypothetical protein
MGNNISHRRTGHRVASMPSNWRFVCSADSMSSRAPLSMMLGVRWV